MSARQLHMAESTWVHVKDGNDTARSIFDQHYSRYIYADGRKPRLFVGPGQKLVLVSPNAKALCVWRKFISADGQQGVNCAFYRNESDRLSSELLSEAMDEAWQRWPGERLYTYVNPSKLRVCRKRGAEYCPYPPGRCFLAAGWKQTGITKHRRLLILEIDTRLDRLEAAAGLEAK